MYSGAGLTLARMGKGLVKGEAEARDGASLAIELAYEYPMAGAVGAACAEGESTGAVMLQRHDKVSRSLSDLES